MTRIKLFIYVLFTTVFLTSCQSFPSATSDSYGIYINLWAKKGASQYVHFIVNPDGQYHYAGGQQAMFRNPQPVTKLSAEQITQIKKLIEQYNLQTVSHTPQSKSMEIIYELELHLKGRRSSVKWKGKPPEGVLELEQKLFEIQSEKRFNQIYKPIERKLEGK